MEASHRQPNRSGLLIRGWFLMTALIGSACLYRLASVGEASLHSVFLGYSSSRLAMMAVLLAAVLAGFAAALDPRSRPSEKFLILSGSKAVRITLTILFMLFSLAWLVCRFLSDEAFYPFFERIEPLLIYGAFVSGSGRLLAEWLRPRPGSGHSDSREVCKSALFFFLCACGIYLFIRVTGVGIVPDEMDWQPTGMAIQYWEILLSMWLGLAVSLLLHTIRAGSRQNLTTVILFFLIWIVTAVLWVTIPTMEVLNHSYFMEITPPNNLPYPASDCANFGLWAESIRAGLGFKTTIAYRQFLIIVIAFFDMIAKHDLLKTIDLLTILLALIPACMYLLGRRLHSHGAGILAAGMAALREYNTIRLGPYYMVSNAKMWLSDLPAMLCLLAAVCACVNWFQKPRSLRRILLAGCLMGLCVTVRSQFIVLIPFPVLFFLCREGLPFRKRIPGAVIFTLAAVMVIAPWFIRSKILTGDFILDEPGVHSTELARRWSDDVTNKVTRNPGESDAEYAARNKQHMIDFFLEKPLYVVRFIASHFTANELVAMTALPFGTDPKLTIHDITNTDFHDVEGRLLKAENLPVLMFFLAVIALGMGAAWKRAGLAGLLPFFMCSLYLGSTAAARYSGWRFALPGDWFYYFYFALGTAEAAHQVFVKLHGHPEEMLSVPSPDTRKQPAYPAAAAGILILFLILGTVPAVCDKIVPQRVFPFSSEENAQAISGMAVGDPAQREQLENLLADKGKTVLNGRIIYPRYFDAGHGLASGHPWIAYKIRDFARLGFVLLNEENHDVILPLREIPAFIPNSADVFVIGADDSDGFFRADAVIIPDVQTNAAPRILIAQQ